MLQRPQLLVSVRDRQEARTAAAAGVEIIDVKEPAQGSLGMSSTKTIEAVATTVRETAPAAVISAACGEAAEWHQRGPVPIPSGPAYLKMGLAGLRRHPDWMKRWAAARSKLVSSEGTPPRWIAVAYVDADLARSPAVEEVIQAAAELRCAGVLFDTFSKQSGRFFDWMSEVVLARHLREIHSLKLKCAAAGRLRPEDVSRLAELPVDIIAVRSAACRNGDRRNDVCGTAIHELQRRIGGAPQT